MTKIVSHDVGGVCGHSTTNFWDEYDLYRLHENRMLPLGLSMELKSMFGFKRMVYRYFKDGRTVIGTVLMFKREHRAGIHQHLGLKDFIHYFQDRYWVVGMPDNLGGGAFTRPLYEGNWDDPSDKELPRVGYIHETDGETSWDKNFVFNDFTQRRHWSVDAERVPYPGRKATRSLGKAYTPSVGHRYGSNVHA